MICQSSFRIRTVVCALSAVLLTGCVAAIPAVMVGSWAVSGFVGYKAYQSMSDGGDAAIGFTEDDESIVDQSALSSITSPAVWPGGRSEPPTAENLAKAGAFETVVTPIQTAQALSQNNIYANVSLMTESELGDTFKKVCQSTPADSVIFLGNPVVSGQKNFFSLKRPAMAYESNLFIFVCNKNTFAYRGARRLEVGANMPKALLSDDSDSTLPDEVVGFVADATAKRLLEIIAPSSALAAVPGGESRQEPPTAEPTRTTTVTTGFDPEVAELQLALTKLGYSPGPIDGKWGSRTRSALELFQSDNNLKITGELDSATKAALQK